MAALEEVVCEPVGPALVRYWPDDETLAASQTVTDEAPGPPLYSGPHGDYTACPAEAPCDACGTPSDAAEAAACNDGA
jgi:hypothetical protein